MVIVAGRPDLGPGAPCRYGLDVRPAVVLFVFGLALRLLFWHAGPDAGPAWHVGFQGDAPEWQKLAQNHAHGVVDELMRLPLRPPGMEWLVATLWNGDPSAAWWPRAVFAALGALVAPLVWLLLRQRLAPPAALLAAGLCAVSSNLLLLGSGLHVELPFLVLTLVAVLLHERLVVRASVPVAIACGALNAALCLLRAEHLLTFATLLALLVWQGAPARWRTVGLATLAFAATVAPWQLTAWSMTDAYNREGAPNLPPAGVVIPNGLPWTADALTAVRALPAFQQAPTYQFVTDTVRVRGGRDVRAVDLDIVRQAYGCWPEPLPKSFVCLYGGLNFFLANTPEANGAFSREALDRPPPLTGGDASYPPGLRRVLPRAGTIAFGYPPHLDAIVHGYRKGLHELASDPGGAALRLLRKAWFGVEGAVGGVGGYALPIGLSGTRRPVDMVTATGWWPVVWRVGVLAVALAGLWTLRRERWAWPWFALAVTRGIVVLAFFGYARQGALCVPVVALGLAAAFARWPLPRWPALARPRVGIAVLVAIVALEAWRARGVTALIDGAAANAATADSAEHLPHAVEFR